MARRASSRLTKRRETAQQSGAADTLDQPANFLHSPPDSNGASSKTDGSDSDLSDLESLNEGAKTKAASAAITATTTSTTATTMTPADVEMTDESENVDESANEGVDEPKTNTKEESKDMDDQDIGEILPADWSGQVPIFKPTMHQFKDFKAFMERIDKYGMKSGIVKIVPPAEWKESLPPIEDLIKQVRVREPIKQDIMGTSGTYRQVNVLHQRSYNIPQWRALCDQSDHQPPARRGERRTNKLPRGRAAPKRAELETTPSPVKRRRAPAGRPSKRARLSDNIKDEDNSLISPVSMRSVGDAMASVEADDDDDEDQDEKPQPVRRMGGVRQPTTQSVSARRKYSRREGSAVIDEEAFRNWDYRMDVSDYTPERCEELERIYWKTLTYAQPLYGADLMGTLFHESTETWNLNKLPNLLDVLGTKVPGVNTAYLYLGMWKATFAWHLEDVDLYSINYLHFGAPKQWYSISQADARRFEAAMRNIWPNEAKACDQFLRHKAFLISPQHLLTNYNIKVNKVLSFPGEFVVTYPYGYHSGYNLGYNCAEAVNFALDSWLAMGKIAKRCECAQAQDSVWVNVYEIERKLRGEETDYETEDEEEDEEEEEEEEEEVEEEEEEGESQSSVQDAASVAGETRRRAVKPAKAKKSRASALKRKAVKIQGGDKIRRVKIRTKLKVNPPCCLCPMDVLSMELLDTDDGRKAHRVCALYNGGPFINLVDGKEVVVNVDGLSKESLELRCLFCRSKRGACVQCSQQKCTRSYHASCTPSAGVFVEDTEVPVFADDGTEYKDRAFEFTCRYHRAKRDKKADAASLEADERIRDAARAVKKGDICQMQYLGGEIFAGVVLENRASEEMLLVDILPSGQATEVEWKWLLVPEPGEYRLPKASANAVALPPTLEARKALSTKRADDEAHIPRKGDLFGDGMAWAEFVAGPDIVNTEQVRVYLDKPDKVWFYIFEGSTEGRALYTHDLRKHENNPKSNFLATVPRPTKPLNPVRRAMPPLLKAGEASTDKPYVYKPRKTVPAVPGAYAGQAKPYGWAGQYTPSPSSMAVAKQQQPQGYMQYQASPYTQQMPRLYTESKNSQSSAGHAQDSVAQSSGGHAQSSVGQNSACHAGYQSAQAPNLRFSITTPQSAAQQIQMQQTRGGSSSWASTRGSPHIQTPGTSSSGHMGVSTPPHVGVPTTPHMGGMLFSATDAAAITSIPSQRKRMEMAAANNQLVKSWVQSGYLAHYQGGDMASTGNMTTGGNLAGGRMPQTTTSTPTTNAITTTAHQISTTPTTTHQMSTTTTHPSSTPGSVSLKMVTPVHPPSRPGTVGARVQNAVQAHSPAMSSAAGASSAFKTVPWTGQGSAPLAHEQQTLINQGQTPTQTFMGQGQASVGQVSVDSLGNGSPVQSMSQQPLQQQQAQAQIKPQTQTQIQLQEQRQTTPTAKVTPVPLPPIPGLQASRGESPRKEKQDQAQDASVGEEQDFQNLGNISGPKQTELKPPPSLMTQFPAASSKDSTPSPTKTMMPPQPKVERLPNIQTKFPVTPARRPSQSSTPALTPTRTPTAYTPTHTPGRAIEYQYSPQPPPQMRPRAMTQPERPPPQEIPPHVMVPPYPFNMPDSKPKRRPKPDVSVIDPCLMAPVEVDPLLEQGDLMDQGGLMSAMSTMVMPTEPMSAISMPAVASTGPMAAVSVPSTLMDNMPVSAVSAPDMAADPMLIQDMMKNLRRASRRVQ